MLPLNVSTSSIVDHRYILATRSSHIEVASPTIIKLNASTSGFFRVRYTPTHLRSLLSFADSMSPADTIGLIQDAGALATAGLYGVGQAMDVFKAFGETVNFAVQRSLAAELDRIEQTWWEDQTVMSNLNALKAVCLSFICCEFLAQSWCRTSMVTFWTASASSTIQPTAMPLHNCVRSRYCRPRWRGSREL